MPKIKEASWRIKVKKKKILKWKEIAIKGTQINSKIIVNPEKWYEKNREIKVMPTKADIIFLKNQLWR